MRRTAANDDGRRGGIAGDSDALDFEPQLHARAARPRIAGDDTSIDFEPEGPRLAVPGQAPGPSAPRPLGESPQPPARPITLPPPAPTPKTPAQPLLSPSSTRGAPRSPARSDPSARPAIAMPTPSVQLVPAVRIPAPSLMMPAVREVQIRTSEPEPKGAPALEPKSAPEPAKPPAPPRREPVVEPAKTADPAPPRPQVTAQPVTIPTPTPAALVFVDEPYSPRADAYRALRRKLAASGNPRVLAVTSAHAGEGKTTLACNLALALREVAKSGVLLVEANHRAPALAGLFGFTPAPCVLEQLARHVDDPRAPWVAAEPMPKLHVMAIDPAASRAPLLDPVAFGSGMDRLKQAGYDYIVVDAPPVLGGVDGSVIADATEGLIFAALPLRSKRKEMRKAVEQLEPAPVLGVVVLEA